MYQCIIFNLTVNFFGQKGNFIYCSIIYKLVTALNNLVTTLKSGRGTLIGVRWLDRAPRQVGLGDRLAEQRRRGLGLHGSGLAYVAGTVVVASNTISAISQPGRITDSIDQSS
jgi:hypothetical protein